MDAKQRLCGLPLVPQRFVLDRDRVDAYLEGVGDEGFGPFEAAVRWRQGPPIAPLTIFDRYLSTYLVGNPALAGRLPPFGVHAKQSSTYRGALLVGREYELRGEVRDLETRRERQYLSIACECVDVAEPDTVLVESVYTRAQSFPDQQYRRAAAGGLPHDRPTLGSWLAEAGAATDAPFPASGAVVAGRSRLVAQRRLDLFLGPGPNFHTDAALARRLGFESTIAAGVMATELECELYRELFGLALFRAARIDVSYIAPIPEGVTLRPRCVVESTGRGTLLLRGVVATESGSVVTSSRVRIGPT